MNTNDPDANDSAQKPPPLSYYSGGRPREPVSIHFTAFLDILAAMLAIGFLVAFIEACQINLLEAPMNGDGSSYRTSAPCNEQWQRNHPKFATAVRNLPTPGCIGELLLFPDFFSFGLLPYAVAVWLACRAWMLRRRGIVWVVLAFALVILLPVLPWIHESMGVIGD